MPVWCVGRVDLELCAFLTSELVETFYQLHVTATLLSGDRIACTPSIRVRMGQSAILDMRVLRKMTLHMYQATFVIPAAIAVVAELSRKFRRSVQLRDAQCPSVRNALCLRKVLWL
jgi:hypothetical protein